MDGVLQMHPRPRYRSRHQSRHRLGFEPLDNRRLLATIAGAVPITPPSLSACAVSPSEIGLTWEVAAADDAAVVIERRTGTTGAFAELATLGGGENVFTDGSCWAGTTYGYRVKVRGTTGDSEYSPVLATTSLAIGNDAFATVADLVAQPASATMVVLSFTDVTSGAASYLVERSANGLAYQVVASLGHETTWTDTALEPQKTYWYRVRGTGYGRPTSDYSTPVPVVMPSRVAAAPIEPATVSAEAMSATAVRVSWTPQDPVPAAYVIERSVNFDPWHAVAWKPIATTGIGATSFVDEGLTAETPYVYRVRATRGGVESSCGRPKSDVMHVIFGDGVGIVTASAGTGGPRTYDIGPGKPLSRISDLDWSRLGPGDTVNIHSKPGGYHELLQVSSRGTAAAWITINGVADPVTGEMPVIDGRDASLAPQFRNHWAGLHGFGAVVVGTRPGFAQGYKPGFIAIRGLDVRGCTLGSSFVDVDGSRKAYGNVGAGVYLERCDHVTVAGCIIHDNGEGIFGAGQSTFDRLMTDIVVDSNNIFGNGNVGSEREHNTYIEAVGTRYQFNRYGPLRVGALGAGLKDRSVGTVIVGNWIEGGLHQLQIPEAQNQADLAVSLPQYRTTLVQGNTLVAPPGNGASLIWFGGDQGVPAWYRKGVLYVHHNTLVARSNQSQSYKTSAIVASSGGEAIDARNNIIAAIPDTSGVSHAELGLVGADNHAYFGRNWVTPGWVTTTVGDYSFTGQIAGVGQFLVATTVDPGFIDIAAGDYRIATTSACVDAAGRLPEAVAAHPLTTQFRFPLGGVERPIRGNAPDVGAFEASATVTAASRLLVTAATDAKSGMAVAVTITARSVEGFVATGYRGTVRLTSNDPRAVLPPAYTFTEKDAGSHTFQAVLATPGQGRVDAVDGDATVASGSVSIAVAAPAPLIAPSGLRVVTVSGSRAQLSWTDRSGNETGFVVERWSAGSGWRAIATAPANMTRYVDSGLRPGIAVAYRVRAVDAASHAPRRSAPTPPVAVRLPASSIRPAGKRP